LLLRIWDGISSKSFAIASGGRVTTPISADATATATGKASSTASPFTTTTDSSQQGTGGLSTGAKVGIGAGVPLGLFVIAGGILAAYFRGRRGRGTPTADASHIEQQPKAEAPQQPPTSFAAGPVTTEKFGHQPAVTEIHPQPQPMSQPQFGFLVPAQAAEKPVLPGISPQISSPSPNTVYEAPTNAPGVTSATELPTRQL